MYQNVAKLCMSDQQLKVNKYPRISENPGLAYIFHNALEILPNNTERKCSRCLKVFALNEYKKDCVNQCIYHPKKYFPTMPFHPCCGKRGGSPGCCTNYHVTNYIDYKNLTDFITLTVCDEEYVLTDRDIFALDCEMSYTIAGLELTRLTVVDINGKIVYDALVKPEARIIDYNTTFTGITEKTMQTVTRTLRDVQTDLLSMFHSKTILVGHSMEHDLTKLKLIHNKIIDTSILYPHRMGPPSKSALKKLSYKHLKRNIQNDDACHSSAEDARACIDLLLLYIKKTYKK